MLTLLALSLAAEPVVTASTAPQYRVAAKMGTATLLFNANNGSPEASLGLLSLDAGAEVPAHVHADSVEMLYFEVGSAEMVVGGVVVTVGAGQAVRIPAGVEHSARVVSPLRAVQVYVAAGPEQRFTAGERVNP